jgi:hypothetical protein
MGSLNILNSMGHVAISWTDKDITIDLAPPNESKATKPERDQVEKIIQSFKAKGYKVLVDQGAREEDDLAKAKKVCLFAPTTIIAEVLGEILNSKLVGNSLLFKIDNSGKGELIQKSEFKLEGDYQTARPLAGG